MANRSGISESEWLVMEAVWQLRQPTAAEVIECLAEVRDWNHRTVRTLLSRLVDKGFLERLAQPGRSTYRATKPRSACVRVEGTSFLKRVFRGDSNTLLMHFAKQSKLSKEKIEQLRRLLEEDAEE